MEGGQLQYPDQQRTALRSSNRNPESEGHSLPDLQSGRLLKVNKRILNLNVCEAPRPQGGASRKRNLIFHCAPRPIGPLDPAYKAGLAGHLPVKIIVQFRSEGLLNTFRGKKGSPHCLLIIFTEQGVFIRLEVLISSCYLVPLKTPDIGKISAFLCHGLDRKARDCTCIVCTHLRVNKGSGGRDKECV